MRYRHVGKPMTPPDSGEREVQRCEVCGRKHDSRLHKVQDDGGRWSYACFAKVHGRCVGGSCACDCHVGPFIPLSLAQRILAGLEVLAEECDDAERAAIILALAAKARAIVERKT